MKSTAPSLILVLLLGMAACSGQAAGPQQGPAPAAAAPKAGSGTAAAPVLADLNKLLAGISDGSTATAAKGQLDALVASLKAAIDKAAAAGGGMGDLGKLAGQAATKLGIGPEVRQQIAALLADPAVAAAIGPALQQLQELLQ